MRAIKFTSWRDDDFYIGFLNEYPDYQTQGTTKEELTENLKDLFRKQNSRNHYHGITKLTKIWQRR